MNGNQFHIKARIILPVESRSWILGKFADRLVENLPDWGVTVDIGVEPSNDVDINHWGIYHICKGEKRTPGTFLITHVDSIWRSIMVKTALATADIGICLSSDTVQKLTGAGIPNQRLCYITPGSDLEVVPRRIVIGLTTNIYANKCKREDILINLAQKRSLNFFEFRIVGKGWENIVPILEASGAKVWLYPGSNDYIADYQKILEVVPQFDYYLYMGLDEGSMGFLDALAAGIPTIVTPQGFHIDVPGGITYPFWETSDLLQIFDTIETERKNRIKTVRMFTWSEYAHKHAILWKAILEQQTVGIQQALISTHIEQESPLYQPPFSTRWNNTILYYSKPFTNYLRRIRKWLKK